MANNIIQLKILLLDTDPEIFRRVLIYDDTPLDALHDIIQCAMGWENDHLHHFIKNKVFYAQADDGDDIWSKSNNESEYTVGDLAPDTRSKFLYEYDFGDSWVHEIKREKLTQDISELKHPICVEGKYACPPEDCGALPGFYYLLEVLSSPSHPEYEERMEWLGEEFNPEFFDLDAVNKKLKAIKYK